MEGIFASLHTDLSALRQKVSTKLKSVRQNVTDLGHRVSYLEAGGDAREEELESYQGGAPHPQGTKLGPPNLSRELGKQIKEVHCADPGCPSWSGDGGH